MENRRRLQDSASESTSSIGAKLSRLASRQEEVKIAYHQLKSQIKIGLAEAEDVFSSLAIPLMKLVGLKTEEMAEEGRFTAIIVDADFSPGQEFHRNGLSLTPESPTAAGGEWNDQIYRKEENCAAKAIIAGKEFYEKQETQLLQLVHLLRQVENRVNSHQDDILQSLATQRGSLQNLFRKAVYYISAFHSQNHDIFLITQKLLQLIFYKTDAVLSSVEDNVQGLMQDLAERMCNPMVEYVKGLRADLKIGTCARLLDTVDEMERCMRNGRIELEEARKKVRVAEEGRIKALCKLKETEEKVRKMKQYHEFIAAIQNQHIEQLASSKFLGVEEANANDHNLVWELERKMRKFRTPGSPMGLKELVDYERKKKHHQSTRARSSLHHRPVIQNNVQALGPETPCVDARIPLGLSPSSAVQQVVSRKRINPYPFNP
ncbi:uncharacterized protein LOC105785696 [Gossypium raimondii]|uniref:Uncharacterized protein n=1 Tax=Gossypium raimondii TaxID=29730 RepID=A0A0D2PM46_GOSRA|nr:uncharacterized protein LOC105785696 [Gossypium raimondii]KJB07934.1 hypothetical protein B456_001G054000 [Gossypium raimondii]MBA0578304.1 hypothetical protein [Gossypium raimondii]